MISVVMIGESYREKSSTKAIYIENVVMVCSIILHIVFESLSVSGTPCKWSVHARPFMLLASGRQQWTNKGWLLKR